MNKFLDFLNGRHSVRHFDSQVTIPKEVKY